MWHNRQYFHIAATPSLEKKKILQAFHILAQAENLVQSKNAQNVLELSPH